MEPRSYNHLKKVIDKTYNTQQKRKPKENQNLIIDETIIKAETERFGQLVRLG